MSASSIASQKQSQPYVTNTPPRNLVRSVLELPEVLSCYRSRELEVPQ